MGRYRSDRNATGRRQEREALASRALFPSCGRAAPLTIASSHLSLPAILALQKVECILGLDAQAALLLSMGCMLAKEMDMKLPWLPLASCLVLGLVALQDALAQDRVVRVALWCRNYEGGGSGKQHPTRNRPYDRWFHGNLLAPCYLLTVGASEAFAV